jgi:lipoyl(octanoyl) transferase
MLLGAIRFIPFNYHSPYENMAIDDFLLNDFLEKGIPSFRLYGWKPAGLSIGVNQMLPTIDTDKCREDNIPVVRRITGGGAILHDSELTYSVVIPAASVGSESTIKYSFEALTVFITNMYSSFGLKAQYAKDAFPDKKHGERSSFCFSSSEEYDMIIKGKKIGGNAQARKKTAIFQHGSIPLEYSNGEQYTINRKQGVEYSSLSELCERNIFIDEAVEKCANAFIESFGAVLQPYEFTLDDKKNIVSLMTNKYGNPRWNFDGTI